MSIEPFSPPVGLSRRACLGAGLAWLGTLAGCATLTDPAGPQGPAVVTRPDVAPDLPPEAPRTRAPRIGLALGGGAARGFAHVGVIQVLEENGIRPDFLTGTSAGSLVAALYASGKTPTELERVAMSMDEVTLTDWALPILGRGLLRGDALARYVSQAVDGRVIDQIKIAVEQVFGVRVTSVNTMNREGKRIRTRRGFGRRAATKRAIVSVAQGDRIDIFGGPVS